MSARTPDGRPWYRDPGGVRLERAIDQYHRDNPQPPLYIGNVRVVCEVRFECVEWDDETSSVRRKPWA